MSRCPLCNGYHMMSWLCPQGHWQDVSFRWGCDACVCLYFMVFVWLHLLYRISWFLFKGQLVPLRGAGISIFCGIHQCTISVNLYSSDFRSEKHGRWCHLSRLFLGKTRFYLAENFESLVMFSQQRGIAIIWVFMGVLTICRFDIGFNIIFAF